MFPTIMPWPMAFTPTNEAVRRKNHAEKNLDMEMKDVRIVLLSKKHKIL
jgi:hypothetical protein